MALSTADKLIGKYRAMKEERAFVEAYYLCASMYGDPMNISNWASEGSSAKFDWNTDLFTGAGIRTTNRFANFMLGNATPPTARWLVLGDARGDAAELDESAEQYWADSTRAIESDLRGDGVSNGSFYLSKASEYKHLAISYGVTYVYEGEEHNGLTGTAVYRARDPYNFYYQLDDLGRMTMCAEVREMTNDQAQSMFGKNVVAEEPDSPRKSVDKRTIIQFVQMNKRPSLPPRDYDEFPFTEYWVDLRDKKILHTRGYYSQPFHVMGWYRVPGSSYYVGPLYDALPDLIGADAARRAYKKALEMVAIPPLVGSTRIKGALKTLRPGKVTWGALDQRGNSKVRALEGLASPGALFADVAEDERRASNAMFEFDLNLPGSANMSATEVSERSQNRAGMLAPFAIHVMGSIKGQIGRHYEIKARAQTLPAIPQTVAQEGRLGVEMSGPLALATRQSENITMFQTLEQIEIIDSMQSPRIDKDEATLKVAKGAGHASILRDPAKVRAEEEQRAALEAQAVQAEIGKTEAEAAKTGTEAINNAIA